MSISHVRASQARLRAVLFDIDDTLLDWSNRPPSGQNHRKEHLARAYQYAVRSGYRMNAPESAYYEIALSLFDQAWSVGKQGEGAPHIGNVLQQTFEKLGVPVRQIDLMALLRAYDWHAVEGVTLFPDVPDVMPAIRAAGIKTGLITNSGHPMWMRDVELNTYGLLEYFPDCRFSAADVGWLKPYPAIFEAVTGAHVQHIDVTDQLGSRERNRRIDPPANVVGPNCWLPAATENPPEPSPAIRTEISIGALTVIRRVAPLLVPTTTGVLG